MLKATISAAVLAATLGCAAVQAADLRGEKAHHLAPVTETKKQDFEGFYVGLGVGGEILEDDFGNDFDGFVGNAVVGFDTRYQSVVLGLRAQGFLSGVEDDAGLVQVDGGLSFGGRAGLVFNRTLAYVHADHEWLFASSDIPVIDTILDDADLRRLAIGGGLEFTTPVLGGLSFGAEASYLIGLGDAEDLDGFRGLLRANKRF